MSAQQQQSTAFASVASTAPLSELEQRAAEVRAQRGQEKQEHERFLAQQRAESALRLILAQPSFPARALRQQILTSGHFPPSVGGKIIHHRQRQGRGLGNQEPPCPPPPHRH